jgi:hypothetical protein
MARSVGLSSTDVSRRQFVAATAAGALTLAAAPAVRASDKAGSSPVILEAGDLRYEVDHHWAQLPDKFTWQTTHNAAVDGQGHVYVIHEGRFEQKDHPAIFVFDSDGKYVRSFGAQFQGGGHGLEIHREGSEEFLYVTAYQQVRSFAKLSLAGETVWHKYAPMESGLYAEGEDVQPRTDNPWGQNRFHPTNYAFHPEGGFYLADGYGAFCIHRYDAAGAWQSKFGEPSDESQADGTFNTPHGVWIDDRAGDPQVVVADRANARLQWFTLEGRHLRTQDGFLLPANMDVQGDLMVVPDLFGRVTLLGRDDAVLAHLGDDSERILADKPDGKVKNDWAIRNDESLWTDGKFVHPHDACFDAAGNLYVVEWVRTGRVTKLRKLG